MTKKSCAAAVLAAAALLVGGAGTAFAGEAQGNSSAGNIRTTPIKDPGVAHSICAFSGQNPERFLDPSDPNYEPGRTQSWGQIPQADRAFLTTIGLAPGDSCNGHTGELTEP